MKYLNGISKEKLNKLNNIGVIKEIDESTIEGMYFVVLTDDCLIMVEHKETLSIIKMGWTLEDMLRDTTRLKREEYQDLVID